MAFHPLRHLSIAAALAATSALAQAQVLNGGFESGLGGWQTIGDASAQGGAPFGSQQLWLTTASAQFQDDFPATAGARNRSGTAAADVGVAGGVESFVGLPIGAIDPDPASGLYAYEGSAAKQSFFALAGDKLSFAWDLGTSDKGGAGDVAFVVIDGVYTQLGNSNAASLAGTLGNDWRTGYSSFVYTFSSTGQHSIAFGVADVGDFSLTSTLAIDAVQIGDVAVVPEPPASLLALAGLGLLGVGRRRRV